MEIHEGKFYINKTSKFLYPILRYYGNSFVSELNKIVKYAIGIHDSNLKDTIGSYNILILINTKINPIQVNKFLKRVEEQEYYVKYYNPSSNIQENKKIIVIKIPEKYYSSYDNFIIGNYSQMYNEGDIKKSFNINSEEYKILSKSPSMKEIFYRKLKKEFHIGKNFIIKDIKEYELPLKCKEEIFNYSGKNKFIKEEDLR
jgi:hypothetical protein